MKIILRACEEVSPINGQRSVYCQDAGFKLKCFKSLTTSVVSKQVDGYVIGDRLSEITVEQYKKLWPGLTLSNNDEKLGNPKSLLTMFELADTFTNEDEIIYFCEDDYLYVPAFHDVLQDFFGTIGSDFENVFFHPTDYPDQYTQSRLRRNYIFKSGLGGWYREVDSTTFTFACKLKTYKRFSDLLKNCAIMKKIGYDKQLKPIYRSTGADDGRFSEIFGFKNPNGFTMSSQTAMCFSPLPGIASHMHIGTESINFSWESFYSKLTI